MLSIQISDIKDFMSHLLSKDTFDHFYFIEASIKMGVSYQIQGRINEGFYDTSVEQTLNREFCYWKEIRHRIFDIIKGKRLPLSCKIVLGLSKQSISYLIAHNNSSFREEDIEGIYVNILYDPKNLLITTGISYKNFSLDKSLEYAFDEYLVKFLKEKAGVVHGGLHLGDGGALDAEADAALHIAACKQVVYDALCTGDRDGEAHALVLLGDDFSGTDADDLTV